ncbi:hypothetical protein SAMN05216232_0356 [Virgibacillus subterraneus]|uniref:Transglutaminase-like domain-containing protein n=1 Tax=Virgibacillus subterraneus TaxID=621109 RepID=A0A1H8ZAP5_9BACI|nr:hypothetical protein [Virgibacillus subterraneus]SEP61494.1 hypothetical protein SAMN05216232_0356 [Virgibacillus subterraneus]
MASLRKLKEIERDFSKKHIDISKVGFYDSVAFMREEHSNPSYLNNYAKYIHLKKYDSTYLSMVREKVPFIANLLFKELKKDGRLGACVDMSAILSRILEEEGIWNHMVFGSLSIDYPPESQLKGGHFWCVDYTKGATAAHAWLVVPPYQIVDLTIKLQPYSEGQNQYLPDILLSEDVKPYTPVAKDLINPKIIYDLQREGIKDVINHTLPQFKAFNSIFPAVSTVYSYSSLHYIPTSVSAPDAPFEQAVNLKLNGRYGYNIYVDIIKPALKEQGF